MSSSPSTSSTSTPLTLSSTPSQSSASSPTAFGPGEGGVTTTTASTPSRPLFSDGGGHTRAPGPPPPGSGYAASLYLFVFLATLLLLLALSVGILVRSFVLRRRFRRRVEEALAAGFLVPGAANGGAGGARWRNMTRPTLHEVALALGDEKAGARWAALQPLNATLIPAAPSASAAEKTATPAAAGDAPGPASSPALARLFGDSRFPHSLAALRRRQEHEQEQEHADAAAADDAPPLPAEPQLQLAVLLAMPARRGEPAELTLGVARERVPDGWPPLREDKT